MAAGPVGHSHLRGSGGEAAHPGSRLERRLDILPGDVEVLDVGKGAAQVGLGCSVDAVAAAHARRGQTMLRPAYTLPGWGGGKGEWDVGRGEGQRRGSGDGAGVPASVHARARRHTYTQAVSLRKDPPPSHNGPTSRPRCESEGGSKVRCEGGRTRESRERERRERERGEGRGGWKEETKEERESERLGLGGEREKAEGKKNSDPIVAAVTERRRGGGGGERGSEGAREGAIERDE